MPIRFPCDHCGGVLSIARRKAYALIDCPKCGCKQVVPNESRAEYAEAARGTDAHADASAAVAIAPVPVKTKSPPARETPQRERPLFERDDIENLLANDQKKIPSLPTIKPLSTTTTTLSTSEIAAGVELLAEGGDVLLRKNQLVLVCFLGVLLFLFAFGLGFLTGKFS